MKLEYYSILIIIGIIFGSIFGIAYGAIIENSITLDNSDRREYGYCPISPEVMLSKAQFEINGCPIVRVYVSNWNSLSEIEKSTIDTQLRSSGFKDIGELDQRVK